MIQQFCVPSTLSIHLATPSSKVREYELLIAGASVGCGKVADRPSAQAWTPDEMLTWFSEFGLLGGRMRLASALGARRQCRLDFEAPLALRELEPGEHPMRFWDGRCVELRMAGRTVLLRRLVGREREWFTRLCDQMTGLARAELGVWLGRARFVPDARAA